MADSQMADSQQESGAQQEPEQQQGAAEPAGAPAGAAEAGAALQPVPFPGDVLVSPECRTAAARAGLASLHAGAIVYTRGDHPREPCTIEYSHCPRGERRGMMRTGRGGKGGGKV